MRKTLLQICADFISVSMEVSTSYEESKFLYELGSYLDAYAYYFYDIELE